MQAIAAPGHTVGHTIFMVTSAGKSFCFLGDLSHHAVLLLEKPRMEFSYDTDPKQAAATRVKLLDMLAANKIPVMSYHFAWPGYGHVAKVGDGFRYYPGADADAALRDARVWGRTKSSPSTSGTCGDAFAPAAAPQFVPLMFLPGFAPSATLDCSRGQHGSAGFHRRF